jgi:Fe-S oxidoreductase
VTLKEMPRSREKSFCCGAGGGNIFNEIHGNKRINEIRWQEAQSTGADTVAAACPFCVIMFDSAASGAEDGSNPGLQDVSELLLRSLGEEQPEA